MILENIRKFDIWYLNYWRYYQVITYN